MSSYHFAGLILLMFAAGCANVAPAAPGAAVTGARLGEGQLGPLVIDPALLSIEKGGTHVGTERRSEVTPPAPAATVTVTPVSAPAEVREMPIVPAAGVAPVSSAAPVKIVAPLTSVSQVQPAPARAARNAAPAKAAANVTPAPTPRAAVAVPAAAAEPPLDMASLKARLRDTKAIGVFSKLALKNQMDDVLDQFRAAYSKGQRTAPGSLRQPYDLLLLKVLALLQEGDPALARAIAGSREAIWAVLADAETFRTLA